MHNSGIYKIALKLQSPSLCMSPVTFLLLYFFFFNGLESFSSDNRIQYGYMIDFQAVAGVTKQIGTEATDLTNSK